MANHFHFINVVSNLLLSTLAILLFSPATTATTLSELPRGFKATPDSSTETFQPLLFDSSGNFSPVRDHDQPHHSNSYDILSIIRLSAIILLVLLLILRALLKLINMLKQQEALSTAPPPLLPIHLASLILPTSDQFPRNVVFVMQQAPPAPPHSHNSHLSLRFREHVSMADDDDDISMDL